MTRFPVTTLLCLGALGLTACGENRPVAANSKICFDFKAPQTASAAGPTAWPRPVTPPRPWPARPPRLAASS
jgi:hypothetical protein